MEQRYYSQEEVLATTEVEADLLQRRNRLETDAAAEVMTEAEEETAATALATLLQQEAHHRSKETWASLAWSGAFLASMLWLIRQAATPDVALQIRLLLCFALMGVLGLGWCCLLGLRSYRRKGSLTAALGHINAKKHIGSLLRALQVQNPPVRALAKERLTTLLPTLRADDASLLTTRDRKVLVRQLAILPNDPGYRDIKELFSRSAFRREMDFRLAILQALEQVGGEQELTAVERLTVGTPSLQNALKTPDELRTAAKTCLPYLRARAEDQRAGAQLLRASSLPTNSAELLRPAASGSSTPPEQLLRAGEPHH